MRKLLVLLVGLIGLGLMMGGCTTVTHANYIKSYINKNYKPKIKSVNKNIKFYITKIVDNRSDDSVITKTRGGINRLPKPEFVKTVRFILNKALVFDGWGVVDNKTKADYVISMTISNFEYSSVLIGVVKKINGVVYIYDSKDRLVAEHRIKEAKYKFFRGIFDPSYRTDVARLAEDLLDKLRKYFASRSFRTAILQGYNTFVKQ